MARTTGVVAATGSFRSSWPSAVIGVPLDDYGIDSVIRLPGGVPVLTAGVGKAGLRNAAIAACQVAALTDPKIAERLAHHLDQVARAAQFDVSLTGA
jgi:5-(carboxyamino)imidazole ribonucleotide mutase